MPIIRSLNEVNNITSPKMTKKINKKLDILDQKLDGLYRDIYVSRPDNKNNLTDILDRLDDSISSMQDDEINTSGMSELLRRIDSDGNSNIKNLVTSVGELFDDQNLIHTLYQNNDASKYILAQDYQYDMILKYLPKLRDALEMKRDNVLSSDNFSKNFINPKSYKSSKTELAKFSSNITKLEKQYEIAKFFDKWYMDTSIYGETFVYIVPYNTAFKRLMKRSNYRKNSARVSQFSFVEDTSAKGHVSVVNEGFVNTTDYDKYRKSVNEVYYVEPDNKFKGHQVNLYFNESNMINNLVEDVLVLEDKKDLERFMSMASGFETDLREASSIKEADSPIIKGKLMKQYEKIKKNNDKLTTADGLIIPDNLSRDPNKIDNKFNGAVVEKLDRANVIPIYIGKICMGYYYFEFAENDNICGYCGNTAHSTPGVGNMLSYGRDMSDENQDMAIRYIASRISQNIDTHFINANKDLKEEIYSILRYNEKFDISRSNDIGVTFIPAEDIVHCYFEQDDKTHRGISDLNKSVTPALLYILLYLTDIMTKISRSNDKRIYYVKQNVETNVARTMMNVVQQIKKGNMGMRQIDSINNILNVVGKYNDYIIPVGPSGDAPVQFEVMNGQESQTPTEIMDKMLEEAINPTGVTLEMLSSIYQQDFAIRYTMTNARFLKMINTRQRSTERFFTKIYTKIYNYEFNENIPSIDIELPPPIFQTMQNTQTLFDNVNQQADKIIELELSDKSDEVKNEFKRIYVHNELSSYLDFNKIEKMIDTAIVNVESKKEPTTEEDNDDVSSMDDDY